MALPNPSMSFSPFAILTAEEMNELVENIESLADGTGFDTGAIPTAAIGDGSVTPEKLALSKTTDANGWTVYDYGEWKEYAKYFTGSSGTSVSSLNQYDLSGTGNLPVGKSATNIMLSISGDASGSAAGSFIPNFGTVSATDGGSITIRMRNVSGASIAPGTYRIWVRGIDQ